jgi:hypothetical protein
VSARTTQPAICDWMDLLAGSAERISLVSGKRAALSNVIIRT